ncbi:MAG: hypothetical protein ACYS8Z_21275 [Planctomycetota bacterium]|jgi:hypothetical protein
MPQTRDNDAPEKAKRNKKRIWLAIVIVLLIAVASLLWLPRDSKTIDERLAEIEATRAIPDSENAAVIYHRLAKSGGLTTPRPGYSDARDTFEFMRPWRAEDHLEVAAWLEDRQDVIGELLKASKFEKYRYKEFVEPGTVIMRSGAAQRSLYRFAAQYDIGEEWRDLLICALSNDIAECRKAAAIEKFLCLTQMADHQRQDTDLIEFADGIATEMMALLAMASFIVEVDAAREDLEIVEAALPQTKGNWARDSGAMVEVYRLNLKKFGYRYRLRYLWHDLSSRTGLERVKDAYLTGLAARRGAHILIALRRHKNRTGYWPESLDEIRTSLTKEILKDPLNRGPFVYKKTKDGFTLYSKGKNRIDEAGKFSFTPPVGPDDWPIWPPPRETKPAGQTSDPNQSATTAEPIE